MPIHVTVSTVQSLSNKTFVDRLSTTNVVFASSGNSDNWSSAYTTVQANSATAWNYQGTDIKSLTGNWQNTYTDFSTQSASNASVFSTVNANSATWSVGGSTIDTGVRALTGNWQSTYTEFSTQSANNISVYSTVQSNSATWGMGGGGADTEVRALTGNWQSTYTTVQSNSSTWGTGGTFTVEDANSIIGLSIFL